jgi:hypothetical protein
MAIADLEGTRALLFGVEVYERFGTSEGRTADPSTALRSGRDDKEEDGASSRQWILAE